MSLSEHITDEIRSILKTAIRQAGCMQLEGGGIFRHLVPVWLDLDRLWFKREWSDALNSIVPLLCKGFPAFDVVAAVSASTGSAGCFPLCLSLRDELGADFILVRTDDFRFGRTYPYSLLGAQELKGRRVLLVKDVILYGATVEHSVRLLREYGATDIAVLILVDQHPKDRPQLFEGQMGTDWCAILGPEDVKEIRSQIGTAQADPC